MIERILCRTIGCASTFSHFSQLPYRVCYWYVSRHVSEETLAYWKGMESDD